MYLGGTRHRAFRNRVRFGEPRGESLGAALGIDFDLSLPQPLLKGLEAGLSVRWDVNLAVDAAGLDAVMAEARQVLDWPTQQG